LFGLQPSRIAVLGGEFHFGINKEPPKEKTPVCIFLPPCSQGDRIFQAQKLGEREYHVIILSCPPKLQAIKGMLMHAAGTMLRGSILNYPQLQSETD
jgi:hypothetical protein